MACKQRPVTCRGTVFSDGTSTPIYVPVSEAFLVADAAKIGITFEVQCMSAQLVLGPALRYSDDGVTWDAVGSVVAVGSTVAAVGVYHRSFGSVDDTRRYYQVGFKVHSASGSEIDKGTVQLKLQFRD